MSNEMKLIMESWRRNVLLEQQADEFQQITVEQFLQKFGKAATSGKRFMNKLLDFVKEYAGKVDELLADDPNGSKVGNWFKALARSAKNYALGKSLELAGMALGGTIGAIISGGATLGAGAVPGAAVGAKVGEEMAKFLKEALTEFWNKGLQEADEAMRKLFLTFQVQDNSSTDPIVKAFDLKDGYSYLLRATNKPKGGEDSEFFKAVFMNFLNQMINLYFYHHHNLY